MSAARRSLSRGDDALLDIVGVPAGRGQGVVEDPFKDGPVDGERCAVLPAVDVDRYDIPGGPGQLMKDLADGGGLPGPGGASEDSVHRARTLGWLD